jgi:S-disulfanyl-L-cysteine oxidoreductase SoxD
MPIHNRSIILPLVATTLCLTLAGAMVAPTTTVTAQTPAATPTTQAEETQPANTFGFGQPATEEEITAWDTDVRPDGVGLPPGSGSVAEGAKLYALHCIGCHSPDGRESPVLLPFRSLVGEYDPATWPSWPLTIGNYWPYSTTVFDYIRRAMPYGAPGILTDDEVYAITAWLLNQNGLIPDDTVMDATTLPQVEMPALQHYEPYDWRDAYPNW